jgi:hypothetical protein
MSLPKIWLRGGLLAIAAAGTITFVGWRLAEGREQERAPGKTPPTSALRVATVDGATIITLDEDDQARSGIRSSVLLAASSSGLLRAYATVIDVGPLTDLSNNALNAQAQVAGAAAKAAASKAAFERAQLLYKDAQNVSLAQMQASEAAYRADQAALAALQAQLMTVVATARQQFGPALGGAMRSSLVQNLVQRQTVLLQVTAPGDTGPVRPPATIAVQSQGGRAVQARLVSLATRADPKVQGASFYYVAPAESGLLPGMNLVTAWSSGVSQTGVTMPPPAIVVWQGQSWAYQRVGTKSFKRVAVDTSLPVAGGYLVTNLSGASQVVTSGAQLLLSEELRPQTQGPAGDPD